MKYVVTILALALPLIGGCSRHAGQEDACTLLPKTVAEGVLDVKLAAPKSQRFGENPRQAVISNCQYVATTAHPIGSLTFTIRMGGVPESSVSPAENFIMTMKQNFGQRYELKKLNGLGDGAVWDSSLRQLTVFLGTTTYVWTAPGATSTDLEGRLVTLARRTIVKS